MEYMERQITEREAIFLSESKWWEGLTAREICDFQLFQKRLCMPFDIFHKAMEEALDRSVWTHEFAFSALMEEYLGEKSPPSFEEIINLIPKDKRIILFTDKGE